MDDLKTHLSSIITIIIPTLFVRWMTRERHHKRSVIAGRFHHEENRLCHIRWDGLVTEGCKMQIVLQIWALLFWKERQRPWDFLPIIHQAHFPLRLILIKNASSAFQQAFLAWQRCSLNALSSSSTWDNISGCGVATNGLAMHLLLILYSYRVGAQGWCPSHTPFIILLLYKAVSLGALLHITL